MCLIICSRICRLLYCVQRHHCHRLLSTRPQRPDLRRGLLPARPHEAGDQTTAAAEDLQPVRPGGQVPRLLWLRDRRHRAGRVNPRLRRPHATSTLVPGHQVSRQTTPRQSHGHIQPCGDST